MKLDKLTFYTPYSASSYAKLTEEVDKVFPPVRSPSSLTRSAGDEAFTDFQYWHGAGGDVRMDLVQMALGTVAAANSGNKSKVLVDGNGKPVSPVTLQKMQLESTSSVYSSTSSSGVSTKSVPPELPPRNKSGEEADSEADDSEEEDDDDVMESIDSFPFI